MEKHLDGWLAHTEELPSTIYDSDDGSTDHVARVVAGATAYDVGAKEGVESPCASSAATSRRGLELARIAGQSMRTTVGSICHQAAICLPATVGGRSRVAETGQTEIRAVLSLPEQDRDCGTGSVLFGLARCSCLSEAC